MSNSEQTKRCEWRGDISNAICGCPAETEIYQLPTVLMELGKRLRKCSKMPYIAADEYSDDYCEMVAKALEAVG